MQLQFWSVGFCRPTKSPPHCARHPTLTLVNAPCQMFCSLRREPCACPVMLITCGYLERTLRRPLLPHEREFSVVPSGGTWSKMKTGLPGFAAHALAIIDS